MKIRLKISRYWVFVILLSTFWVWESGVAAAADVKGKLLVGAYKLLPAPKSPRPAFYWELENGFKEVTPDRISPSRELAVVLLGASASAGESNVEVAFSGGSLLPSTIVVRTNTTLRIRNQDEVAHELYAAGLDRFPPEATSPRAIRSLRLAKAGAWPLLDRLITHVRGYLHVLENLAAVANVASDGSYSFTGAVPGKYQLKVFHGPLELVSRVVEVGEGEVTLDPIALTAPAKSR